MKKEIPYSERPYHITRELDSFQEDIDLLRKHGYNPIAVTQLYFEDTFVFKTPKEAKEAYQEMELKSKPSKVVGWWYGKKKFLQIVKKYERENDGTARVLIFWLPKANTDPERSMKKLRKNK